jgi:guanosine-3',5'-bis(diphosphate) 3'-pyrophosphohydrolase
LRDVAKNPPKDWLLERRVAYFDWAREVVDGLRGDWPILETAFDQELEKKPDATAGKGE